MTDETRHNLMVAMQGEAFAHAKYMLYADHARQNARPDIADLFERLARDERLEHFAEQAELLKFVKDDEENLRAAIAAESYEIDTMYRDFAAQARKAGDIVAADRFEEIRWDEMRHRDALEAALDRLLVSSR